MSSYAQPKASALHIILALVLDLLLVVLFSALGNREHSTGSSVSDAIVTAWPFLAGLAVGWLVTRSWRQPARLWPEGIIVVIITVAVGMVLRVLFTTGGAPLAFILVATGTLTLLLLMRRLISRLIMRTLAPMTD